MVFLIRTVLLLFLSGTLMGCTQLFFYPKEQLVLTPRQMKLEFQDIFFTSTKGITLHGWFLPASQKAMGTVLFLHGNAENISTHIWNVYWLAENHFNVFLFDYRGYGRSEGTPTLEGLHKDVESALGQVISMEDTEPHRLIILGQSLGGALAIYTVAYSEFRNHIKALVVESAFSSYPGITQEKLAAFWLTWPLQWVSFLTVCDAYEPLGAVAEVSPIPLLLIHGDDDPVVPAHHAYQLYKKARDPKSLWVVEEGGHIEAFRHPQYRRRLVTYLKNRIE